MGNQERAKVEECVDPEWGAKLPKLWKWRLGKKSRDQVDVRSKVCGTCE